MVTMGLPLLGIMVIRDRYVNTEDCNGYVRLGIVVVMLRTKGS